MTEDEEFLKEIRVEFLEESLMLIDNLEESFMTLEEGESDPTESLNEIFRIVHSIKGTSQAVDLMPISVFSHKMEDCLSLLRQKPEVLTSDMVSLLLKGSDCLRNGIELCSKEQLEEWIYDHLIQEFQKLENLLKYNDVSAVGNPKDSSIEQLKALDDELSGTVPLDRESSIDSSASKNGENPKEKKPKEKNPKEKNIDQLEKSGTEEKEGEPTPTIINPVTLADANLKIEPWFPDPSVIEEPLKEKKPQDHTSLNNVTKETSRKEEPRAVTKSQSNTAGSPPKSSIKIDAERVEQLLNIVGEVVVLKSQLVQTETVTLGRDNQLTNIVAMIDKTVRELHENSLSMRMTPLKPLFTKLKRIIRDLSKKINKPVEVEIYGENVEIDRAMIEILGDPMVHVVRNSIDHGIEETSLREEQGKQGKATISISALQRGGQIHLEILDDGGGINPEIIKAKALEKGIINQTQALDMPDHEAVQLIFAPGFSTAAAITDISGRGVGLDVVKSNLAKIKGHVEVVSELGKGSTFRLVIPMTTSITDGVVAYSDGRKFVIPTHFIREVFHEPLGKITRMSSNEEVINWNDKNFPVLDLNHFSKFSLPQGVSDRFSRSDEGVDEILLRKENQGAIFILGLSRGFVALRVDAVIGQFQLVVKPLGLGMKDIVGVSGATILGDGKVAIVLDVEGIAQNFQDEQSQFTAHSEKYSVSV